MDSEFQESTCFGSLRSMVGSMLLAGCSRFIEELYRRYRDAVLLRCLHHCLHHHSHQWCRIKFLIYAFPSTKSNCTAPKACTVPCLEPDLTTLPSIHAALKGCCKVLLYSMGCAVSTLQVWTLQCLDGSCFACQSVFISTAFMHVRLSLTDIINQDVKGYLFIAYAMAFLELEALSADTLRMGTC